MVKITDPKTGKSETLTSIAGWKYASQQQQDRAGSLNAQYVLVRGAETSLPQWVTRALAAVGLAAERIGYTTYKSTTYAIFPVAS
jgi:hypothetical protein